jgi:membrane protein
MSARAADASHPSGRHVSQRLQAFFSERIWNVRLSDLRRGQALLYRIGRVGYSTVQGFVANRLTVRAAALTYSSVLAIVPFLAFAFAILKGFGAYNSFIQGTARPWLRQTFGENAALLRSIDGILEFVDRTNVSTLGALGLLTLVYTSVSLLGSVEDTLNEVWGARTRRSFLRQVTDYVTLLVTTPLLVVAATTAVTAAQSSSVVLFLRGVLGLGDVIDFFLHFASLAVVGLAFFATYTILPNVRARPLSAAIGAVVAAALWQAALVVYVRFQIGVSSYNALYSVLSAIPVFLVWTYVSWLVVLVGAQVAASHQNERVVRQRLRARATDEALKELLAVQAVAQIARAFVASGPWRDDGAFAERLGIPPLVLEETLEALVRGGVLARTTVGRDASYVPARDPDALRLSDVRDALRRDARADAMRTDVEQRMDPELRRVLGAAEEERRTSRHNLTLRELAALVDSGDAPPLAAPPRAPGPTPAAAPIADAK